MKKKYKKVHKRLDWYGKLLSQLSNIICLGGFKIIGSTLFAIKCKKGDIFCYEAMRHAKPGKFKSL